MSLLAHDLADPNPVRRMIASPGKVASVGREPTQKSLAHSRPPIGILPIAGIGLRSFGIDGVGRMREEKKRA
ncbi:hypothetical protein RBSH_02000 [Rhodopirellula baltica SH28]|uniref:Uncharacterized protein n=1 Tax=Rhodopirellula baltica SH28 TaxID=993517 RepID=K5D7B3_RHOBT|nr:hypothetical protein RBSH_02000 [Rhodopirellula baltica SH28]